jgi:subtilase family serine protease
LFTGIIWNAWRFMFKTMRTEFALPKRCGLTLNPRFFLAAIGLGLAVFSGTVNAGFAADRQWLQGHIPAAVSRLKPAGVLPATNRLNLAIGLPLRNEQAMDDLLRQIYDPASPNYRQYVTQEQFTDRFAPAEQDYQAVIEFAEANGLTVTATHPNRLVVDVSGTVADIQRAFHLTMNVYQHPGENRTFYAPNVEPSADLAVPVLHIGGLDDFSLKRPMGVFKALSATTPSQVPSSGSGPGNSYMGNDFRAAYLPGVSLTGTGQNVALVEFDGFASNDIVAYIAMAGLTNHTVNVIPVPVNGGVPVPGAGNGEVCLDIEMVLSISPGVSNIYVYEAPNGSTSWATMLSAITNDVATKQISSSWGGGGPDSSSEKIFKVMALFGQTYFNASGDNDAFTGSIPFPSDSTNITEVGGTVLTTTGPLGAYVSETVWNERTVNPNGGNWGSSGGISPTYGLPIWQQGINMTTNLGSTTKRNLPDVALTAANIFIISDNNQRFIAGGTSCAAPLWAGFIALVNQQAAAVGRPSVGFINPAIYAIGKSVNYNADFHDITTGDNTWSGSPTKFFATTGFDLCTGWGTPAGASLINALASDPLVISPASGFNAYGATGGAFTVSSQIFMLTNMGGSSLNWQIASTSAWLNVSSTSGTLPAAGNATVTIGLNAAASNLAAGTYAASVRFTNRTSSYVQTRQFTLQAVPPLVVAPASGFTAAGPVSGPFSVTAQNFSLTNLGTVALNWSLINTSVWLNASPAGGTLTPNGGNTTVGVTLNAAAGSLVAGVYPASLWFSNQTTHAAQNVPFILQVGQSVVQNGGFETGDFSFWSRANAFTTDVDANGTISGIIAHSGAYLAVLGTGSSLGTLSQTLPTVANQAYLLSLWLNSPTVAGGNTPNEFSVSWNGSTLFDQVNIGPIGWTNLQFIVTATSSSTVLQIGERDDPWYLGLDDVTAVPITNPAFRSVGKMSNSNAVVLTWNSMAGFGYQVQYSTNLAATNWIILGTNTAVGPTLTFTNGYGKDPRRFYRIRQLP